MEQPARPVTAGLRGKPFFASAVSVRLSRPQPLRPIHTRSTVWKRLAALRRKHGLGPVQQRILGRHLRRRSLGFIISMGMDAVSLWALGFHQWPRMVLAARRMEQLEQ